MAKSEMETVIVWTSDDERATVTSLMPRIWRMCIAAGGEEIRKEEGVRDGNKLVRWFLVPIKSIRIRKPPRVLTEEQVQAQREKGRALAARRMGLTPTDEV